MQVPANQNLSLWSFDHLAVRADFGLKDSPGDSGVQPLERSNNPVEQMGISRAGVGDTVQVFDDLGGQMTPRMLVIVLAFFSVTVRPVSRLLTLSSSAETANTVPAFIHIRDALRTGHVTKSPI